MRLFVLAAALGISGAVFAAPPVPRPSPEFVIALPPVNSGKQLLLSQFKGKVVALEFLFTTCPHCQHEAGLLTKLYRELGPRGFEPVGVGINPMAGMLVPDFVRDYQVGFPVGYSERDPALGYMGISVMERWVVPQLLLIDRKGVIRYQTPALGAEEVQNEAWLRGKIEELLKEGAPASTTSKKTNGTASRKKST